MAPTLTGQIHQRLGREQLVAVVGKKRIHRPVGDQVAAPGSRVQLVIGWMACRLIPGTLPAPSANYRIDAVSQIDNNDGSTPDQQTPVKRAET